MISERQLHRHSTRAGFRIGDGRHIDLYRYVAWLVAVRNEPKPETTPVDYEVLKKRARARNVALSLADGPAKRRRALHGDPDLLRNNRGLITPCRN